jgi:hypothetical protein
MSGDEFLSSFELRLWSLQQEIIFRWGVFTLFRWDRADVRFKINDHVWWFVPRASSQCFEISQFIEKELERDIREEHTFKDGTFFPGLDVTVKVLEFDGVQPYIEQDEILKMAENMTAQMMAYLKKLNKEDKGGTR